MFRYELLKWLNFGDIDVKSCFSISAKTGPLSVRNVDSLCSKCC